LHEDSPRFDGTEEAFFNSMEEELFQVHTSSHCQLAAAATGDCWPASQQLLLVLANSHQLLCCG